MGLDQVPQAMRQERRWCTWKYVDKGKGKKPAKVPTPTVAQVERWMTFDQAVAAAPPAGSGGIGFMLGGGWGGVDLDNHCDDIGTLDDLAHEVMQKFHTYTEYSPSGLGIKCIFKTSQTGRGVDHQAGIEVYTEGRYFTVTGDVAFGSSADVAQDVDIAWLLERVGSKVDTRQGQGDLHNLKGPLPGWDIERARLELSTVVNVEDYEPWLQVGMALHHQGEGGGDWLALWDEWSQRSSKYPGIAELESRWAGFNDKRLSGAGAVTLRTLVKEGGLAVNKIDGAPVASDVPPWVQDWVYVKERESLFAVMTRELITPTAFRAQYQHLMIDWRNAKGMIPDVWQYTQQYWPRPTVTNLLYRPGVVEVFEEESRWYANMWSEQDAPAMPTGPYTDGQRQAIQVVLDFISLLWPDAKARETLIYWAARLVQDPAYRFRWMILLVGVQGSGKTLFTMIMQFVLGARNVTRIENKDLHSQFNGYAENAQLCVSEEVKQSGHPGASHQVYDAFLTLITNDYVAINVKFQPGRVVKNTVTYIATTNARADALPLPADDRRVWVLVDSISEADAKRLAVEGYYARVHDTAKANVGALRRFLNEVAIPRDFDKDKRAPESDAKGEMSVAAQTDAEYVFDELMHASVPGLTKPVIVQSALSAALKAREVRIGDRGLNRLLVAKGYRIGLADQRLRAKIDGRTWVLCVHRDFAGTRDEAIAIAKASLMVNDSDAL
jgi:hypothetical protein